MTKPDHPAVAPRQYVVPSRRRWPVLMLLVAAALAALAAAIVWSGRHPLASPGPLAPVHAALAGQPCEACHRIGGTAAGVGDLRCVRCHAQGGGLRLELTAHAGSVARSAAGSGADAGCASCHEDHRGARTRIAAAPDRQCVSCHAMSSMSRHPEIAARAAGAATGEGLHFSHERHLREIRPASGNACLTCHERRADAAFFLPLAFDRHCASCHEKNDRLESPANPVDPQLLLPVAAGAKGPALVAAERGRLQAVGLQHRDPWVLDNLRRLRRALDPPGVAGERLVTEQSIRALEAEIAAAEAGRLPQERAALAAERDRLRAEVAELDTLVTPGGDGRQPRPALDTLKTEIDALTPAPELRPPSPAASGMPALASIPGDQRRRERLLALLDAVSERGGPGLTAAAADLRRQLLALPAERGADSADAAARLQVLDGAAERLSAMPDRGAAEAAAAIAALAAPAAERLAARLPAASAAARGVQLARLLEAVAARDPRLATRVAILRDALSGLDLGADGPASLRRLRDLQRRSLERLDLELELHDTVRLPQEMPAPPRLQAALTSMRDRLVEARTHLAAIDEGARLPPLPPAASREDLSRAAAAVAAGCVKCHDVERGWLMPVTAARPRLSHAAFSHAPHTDRVACGTCHQDITRSTLASDANVPAISTCATCHGTRAAPARCITCHRYHPPQGPEGGSVSWTVAGRF
ncbi:MAG: cytochrome c3 family protein [Acidobacteriota bacterium]